MAGQSPMSVPGVSGLFGGDQSLAQQVAGETDEERKKRLANLANAQALPVGITSLADGYGSAFGMS